MRKKEHILFEHQLQYLQFIKADVQSVGQAYRGRFERAVEWMSPSAT